MSDIQIAEVLVSVSLDPNSPLQQQAQRLIASIGKDADTKLRNALSEPFSKSGVQATQIFEQKANQALNSISRTASQLGRTLSGVFAVAAASVAAIGVNAIRSGIKFNKLQQSSRGALGAILGSKEAASALLVEINKLNDTSPFPRGVFLQAAQQMAAFGVEASKIPGIIDAAQQAVAAFEGTPSDLLEFTNIFSQIQSFGKVTGDILQRFSARGVDAVELVAEATGESMDKVRDSFTSGALDAAQSIDIITQALATKFAGATESVRKNFAGARQALDATLRNIGGDLTKAFIDPLGGGRAVVAINNFNDALRNVRKNLISQLIPFTEKLGDLLVQISEKAKQFSESLQGDNAKKLLDIMKSLAPALAAISVLIGSSFAQNIPVLGKFATALGGPVGAIVAFALTSKEARDALLGLFEALQPALSTILPTLAVLLARLSDLFGSIAANIISSLTPAIVAIANSLALLLPPFVKLVELLSKLAPVIAPIVAGFFAFKAVNLVILATSAALTRFSESAFKAALAAEAVSTKMGGLGGGAKAAAGAALGLSTRFAGLAAGALKFAGPAAAIASIALPLLVQAFGNSESEAEKLEKRVDALGTALENAKSKAEAADIVFKNLFTENEQEAITLTDSDFNARSAEVIAATKAVAKELKITFEEASKLELSDAGTTSTLRLAKAKAALQDANKGLASSERAVEAAATAGNAAAVKQTILAETTGKQQEKLLAALDRGIAANKAAAKTANDLANENKNLYGTLALATATFEEQIKATDALNNKLQVLAAAQLAVTGATQAAKDAQEDLNDAIADSKTAVADRNELQAEYNTLLANTVLDVRELADAEEDLLGVRRSLRDLDQSRLDLLEQLAELNTPADADDIVSAQDKITKSQIAYNQLLREQAAEEDALTPKTKKRLNLQGLSLDEVRSNLRNVREALAAQKDGAEDEKKQKDDFLTVDEKRILAEIAVRDAAQEVTDAKETLLDLQNQVLDNSEEILGIEQDIADLDEDRIGLLEDEFRAIEKVNLIRSGDTERAKTLKGLEEEIATADERIATAQERVKDAKEKTATAAVAIQTAEEAIALARATAIGDEGEILRLKKLQTDELFAQLNIRDAFNKQAATALFTTFASTFAPTGQAGAQQRQESSLNKAANLLNNPNFIAQLSEALLKDPASDLRTVLKELFRRAGIILPGFKDGGIVTGSGAYGTLIRAGEYGKKEAVLPLTSTTNALSTLQSGLKYMTPQLQSILGPSLGMGSAQPLHSLSGRGGANYNADRIGPGERELLDLLRDIRDGVSNNSGGQVNNFEITAQGQDANVVSRKVVQEIQRKLDRL